MLSSVLQNNVDSRLTCRPRRFSPPLNILLLSQPHCLVHSPRSGSGMASGATFTPISTLLFSASHSYKEYSSLAYTTYTLRCSIFSSWCGKFKDRLGVPAEASRAFRITPAPFCWYLDVFLSLSDDRTGVLGNLKLVFYRWLFRITWWKRTPSMTGKS